MITRNLEILLKIKLTGNEVIIDKFATLLYKGLRTRINNIMVQTKTEGEILQLKMVKKK